MQPQNLIQTIPNVLTAEDRVELLTFGYSGIEIELVALSLAEYKLTSMKWSD